MKYFHIFILSLIISLLSWFTFWYQQYWFSEYNEKSWNISFSCSNQCYITLWEKDNVDYLKIQWSINWNWSTAYWFIIWEEIALINQQKVFLETQVNESINFTDYAQYFSSIPWNANLILLINWNIKWEINVDANVLSISERLGQWWKDFRKMETFTPYSINLRYWVSILWKSIVRYWYIIFIIVWICVLIFKKWKKEEKYKTIFYVWIWIFLFIWIRNTITYTTILDQWLKWFNKDKTYFDLWDYISFTDKIRTELKLDSKKITKDDCKIYISSIQERPFTSHRESFYLKPCERVYTWELADYKIYYKTEIPTEDLNKKLLIQSNNNYLLENKSK